MCADARSRCPLTPRSSPVRLRVVCQHRCGLAGLGGGDPRAAGGTPVVRVGEKAMAEANMGSYEGTISALEAELAAVERVFAGLSGEEWRLPTKLVPVDPDLPRWTVFELARHFDISIGLTRMLIAGADAGQPARDRTSFFINPRSQTAPVVLALPGIGDGPGLMDDVQALAVPAGPVRTAAHQLGVPIGPDVHQPAGLEQHRQLAAGPAIGARTCRSPSVCAR